MRIRLLAIAIVLFSVCGLVAAQSYHIQVAHNTNLRESYSLNAGIVETAPAGTTLLVTGQYGKWLKINRNGEVWMANWVRHTRVDAPATAAQPANIDNCCFVDRQCSSDHEWTAGYWAFQNGHCAAPVQSQSPAPAQSSSGSAPANVDNCCFIGWNCSSDQDWQAGYHAYQTNQCKHPGLEIVGSARFVQRVEEAMDFIRERSAHWYNYTQGGLNKVSFCADCVGVDVHGRHFHLNEAHAFLHYDADRYSAIAWLAGVLVHEACHVYRIADQGFPYGTEFERFKEEVICQQVQIDALNDIEPRRLHQGYLQGLIDDFFGRGHTL